MTDEATIRRNVALFGLPNSGWVHPGVLARSGQPSPAEFLRIHDAGFRSAVGLREEHNASADAVRAGLRFLWLPTPDHHPVSEVDVGRFREWIGDPDNLPCVYSCEAGSGRAGYLTAVVRWSADAWGRRDIREEAERYRTPHWSLPFIGWLDRRQRRAFDVWVQEHEAGGWRA